MSELAWSVALLVVTVVVASPWWGRRLGWWFARLAGLQRETECALDILDQVRHERGLAWRDTRVAQERARVAEAARDVARRERADWERRALAAESQLATRRAVAAVQGAMQVGFPALRERLAQRDAVRAEAERLGREVVDVPNLDNDGLPPCQVLGGRAGGSQPPATSWPFDPPDR